MKPFNLKEYLEHPDWEVVTREGEPVRILCTDLDDNDYPVAAATRNRHVDRYTADGLFQAGKETKYDLFFYFKKFEAWTLFVKCAGNFVLGPIFYDTIEEARRVQESDPDKYGPIVKVEWEEEQ